jgi:hypothetical protein
MSSALHEVSPVDALEDGVGRLKSRGNLECGGATKGPEIPNDPISKHKHPESHLPKPRPSTILAFPSCMLFRDTGRTSSHVLPREVSFKAGFDVTEPSLSRRDAGESTLKDSR